MIKKSAIVAIVWVVLALGAACLVAYFGRIFVGEELLTQGLQKTVFMVMSRKFFFPLASGLLLAAIMAACISTADSQLLVASSSFTSDIYKPIIRKDASEREVLWIGRIVVVIVALIAFLLASSKGSGAQAIMNLVENAWGLLRIGIRTDDSAFAFLEKIQLCRRNRRRCNGCGCRRTLARVFIRINRNL